jgi:hypothetical protein
MLCATLLDIPIIEMEDEIKLQERQYKLAIDAKDKLNDNYHRWMTFYYVANGAVLVAATTLFDKSKNDHGVFVFALIGIFICLLWNLSCKGYYYWSNSWINIIIDLEKKVTNGDKTLFVYSAFSKKVADEGTNSWLPLKPANISTPKLTLLFSFFSIVGWTTFSVYEFLVQYSFLCFCCKVTLIAVLIITVLVTFFTLPKFVKSRQDNKHTLVGQDE